MPDWQACRRGHEPCSQQGRAKLGCLVQEGAAVGVQAELEVLPVGPPAAVRLMEALCQTGKLARGGTSSAAKVGLSLAAGCRRMPLLECKLSSRCCQWAPPLRYG